MTSGKKNQTWEHNHIIVYCRGDATLAWIAQGGCGGSVRGGSQNLTGHGPQPALGDPALSKEVGPDGLQGPPPPSAIL